MNSSYPESWKNISDESEENSKPIYGQYKPKDDRLYGQCTIQIYIQNHGEYLKWKKYVEGNQHRWDFMVNYPAVMRSSYIFHKVQDLDMITRKIVMLLQSGFNVRAVDWQLKDYKSQLNTEK